MATYEYHAIRAGASRRRFFVGGVVVAGSDDEARAKLRERGMQATMLKRDRGIMSLLRWFDADVR
jgi:type II secretory pathway component PulF